MPRVCVQCPLSANSGHCERTSGRVFSGAQIGATVNGQVGSLMVECGDGTLDDPDLRRDLFRDLQNLQDSRQQVDLPTAVLGGVFLIATILLIMNYNHPFSSNARIYFATTPIMPTVKGRVIEVPVKANAPLKQGDVLFKIDPRPYQYQVDQRKALLAEAEQNVKQLKAAYDQALAKMKRSKSSSHSRRTTTTGSSTCSKRM